MNRKAGTALIVSAALLLAGCAGGADPSGAGSTAGGADVSELRLGFFPNFTHAPALVALEKNFLQEELGDGVKITPVVFNAGPAAIEALFGNAVDMSFIGPNPAITGYAQSDGAALRVVAGAASGGAALVVRDGIDTVKDLKGTTLATPQLGNTQDVALRYFLKENGFETTTEGGGDVKITPQDNAATLAALQTGDIDGAWVPEPWTTRLQVEGGAHVLVNEADLWDDGKFVVTHLISATTFLKEHPGTVEAVIRAEERAIEFIQENPEEAKQIVNDSIEKLTGKAIASDILDAAWENVTFTLDPLTSSLFTSAKHAEDVGLLKPVDLRGIYDLDILNRVLADAGKPGIELP